MPFAETLSDFINADTPGYVLATVGGVATAALFEGSYVSVLDVDGVGAALHVASADASAVTHGTAVVVDSVNYRVAGMEPDGHGMTVLRLERT